MTEQEMYQYIEMNPFRGQKPVFRNTNITVEHITEDLAKGMSIKEILGEHKQLTEQHIQAAFVFAHTIIKSYEKLRLGYVFSSLG